MLIKVHSHLQVIRETDMPEYYNVTTNIGDAEIAKAISSNTKLDITHIAFGDGNGSVPTPSKMRTTLVKEVHRQAVTKYERHPTIQNWIVIETIIPSNVGGFWVREMGIIANGKLISHGSHAPFEKVADQSGVSEYRLKFTQDVRDGNVVSIKLDDSLIYATQSWVEENFIKRNEIIDNLNSSDATKPLSAAMGKKLQDEKLGATSNAVSASKLQTERTVSFSGAATGSFKQDWSKDSSCLLTLANSGVSASTYGSFLKIPVITVNAKGLITTVTEKEIQVLSEDEVNTGTSITPKLISPAVLKKAIEVNAPPMKLKNTLDSDATDEGLTAAMGKKLNNSVFCTSPGVDQTANRRSGIVYTNPYDRPLYIFMSFHDTNGANLGVQIGDLKHNWNNDLSPWGYYPVTFIVPPHTEYKFIWAGVGGGSGELLFWWEF